MMTSDDPICAIQEAAERAGGQRALAEKISATLSRRVQQQNVWSWINRSRRVPAEMVIAIEAITGVSRHRLRPDIYPRPGASEAA